MDDNIVEYVVAAVSAVVFCIAIYLFIQLNGGLDKYIHETYKEGQIYSDNLEFISIYP